MAKSIRKNNLKIKMLAGNSLNSFPNASSEENSTLVDTLYMLINFFIKAFHCFADFIQVQIQLFLDKMKIESKINVQASCFIPSLQHQKTSTIKTIRHSAKVASKIDSFSGQASIIEHIFQNGKNVFGNGFSDKKNASTRAFS